MPAGTAGRSDAVCTADTVPKVEMLGSPGKLWTSETVGISVVFAYVCIKAGETAPVEGLIPAIGACCPIG